MADNTINIDLIINAAKSAKTLEQQREALKDLRDGLDKVKQGSGAFELLTDSVTELQKEMGLLNLTFEDAYGNIKPLTGQIGELEDRLYQLALAGQQNTEEFQLIQAETVRLKKSLRDVDDTIDALSQRGAKLRGFIQVAEGIAGGFAAAQGALALFGNENEQVEKAILKVQGAMSLLQGIQALSTALTEKNALFTAANTAATSTNTSATLANATAQGVSAAASAADATAKTADATATAGLTLAQRALNAVMAISPMGLITLAVTGAVAAYSLLTGKTKEQIAAEKEATATKKRLAEEQKRYTEYIAKESVDYRTLVEQLRQTNPQSAERLTLIKQINATYGTTFKNLKDEDAFNNQLNVSIEKYIENLKTKYALQANGTLIEQNLKKQAELNNQAQVLLNGELKSSYDTIVASMVQMGTPLVEAKAKAKDYLMTTNKDLININNQLKAADTRLGAYVNFGIESSKKITDASNKATETVIKNSDKATTNDVDNIKERERAAKEYYAELQRLREQDQDLNDELVDENFYKYSTEAGKFYNQLEKNYKNDLIKYQKSLDERTEKDKVSVTNKIITQAEADANLLENQRVFEELKNNRLRKFELDAGKFRSDIERKIVEDTLKLNKIELDNKLDKLSKEAKAKKDSYDKERESNKKLSDDTKKTLTEETLELTKNIENKNKVLAKYDIDRAAAVERMNAATSQQAREDQVIIIESIDTKKLQAKVEIENNNLLLKQKKEQLDINEKLYGVGQAKIQAEELKKIEKLAGDERIKAINEYYEKQKSTINAISDQIEGQLDLTTDTLLFDKEQFKNIEDFTNAVTKSINETLQTANQQVSNTPLVDEKTGEILLEAFDKLNDAEKKARLATKKEYEDKARKEEAFLDATVGAYEDANFKKLENSKNTTNLLIKLDNEKTDLLNQNLDGTTKKAEETTKAVDSWYEALSDNQQANFDKTIQFILQASQIIADTISQETDRNIANIERIREAELQAFDESQELREMERNDATAADYQEVIRKRSIADQRLAIEDEFNNKIKAEKRRAFEAQKAASLIEIGINTAVEISKTLANPFLAVLVGLAGAAQAAFVLNSPTPEFAKGGLLEGPSHAQGGIKTQFGELEGGEAVINKKSTKKYMPLLSAINEAGGGVQFASGGVLPSQTIIAEDTSKLDKIEMMLERFAAKPILTYVNESDVTRAQRNQRKIEKRTTF